MSQHDLALIFYGVGLAGLVFSLVRTYYRVHKIKKEAAEAVRKPLQSSHKDPKSPA